MLMNVISKLLLFILPIFQKKSSQSLYLLFDDLSGKSQGCDSQILFKYLRDKGFEAYYAIHRDHPLCFELLRSEYFPFIIVIEKAGYQLIYRTFFLLPKVRFIIASFGSGKRKIDEYFYKNSSILYICNNHGVTFLKKTVFLTNYLSPQKYNYYIASSKLEEDIMRDFGWEGKQFIRAGLPRWDFLRDKSITKPPKKIFIFFTWRHTFRNRPEMLLNSVYFRKIKSLVSNLVLQEQLQKGNIEVVIGGHPMMNDYLSLLNTEYVKIISQEKFKTYIEKSSLLITDFSSMAWDFFILSKPVLFYKLDAEDMKLDKYDVYDTQEEKSFLDFCTLDEESQLVSKVVEFVQSDFLFSDELKEISQKFFYKENFCEHICNEFKRINIKMDVLE